MFILTFFLIIFAGSIHTGISSMINVSMINNNETMTNGNQFAEIIVGLLLDLVEKANLSRTISIIHNDTELTEFVKDDNDIKSNTTELLNI
ncbi:unnamed protein product [Adineta steineri]|uniref:Uncharacterized protein n=1 Tax=Adineta steineri TaxID=433720 RepID=A0A819ESS1_9BILA|nr:unnamed protein product [Adineta steineri]CAF3855191.1 unnamed protein product [Adineta steineri]